MSLDAFGWIVGVGAILASICLAISSVYDLVRRTRRHA